MYRPTFEIFGRWESAKRGDTDADGRYWLRIEEMNAHVDPFPFVPAI